MRRALFSGALKPGAHATPCSPACIVLTVVATQGGRPANAQCPSLVRQPSLRRPHKLSAEEGERGGPGDPAAEEKKVPPKPLGDSRVTFRSDRRRGPPRIQHLGAIPAFPFPLFIRGALPDVRVVRGRARRAGPFWGRCRGPVDVRLVSARSTKRKDGCPKGALCRKKRAVPSEGSLKKEPALAKFGAALYAR